MPNESSEEPSLPLSMKQRQQLKQLEQVIVQSPDPEGTLKKAAESNGLSAQDLAAMIQKNSNDLQENPSLAQPTTIPKASMKIFATFSTLIIQKARKNPKSFTLTMVTLFLLLYTTFTIPRTGLHTSNKQGLLSKGPTCWTDPPQRYLQHLVDVNSLAESSFSIKSKKTKWDDLALEKDGVEIHTLSRKSPLKFAASSRLSLKVDSFIQDEYEGDDDEEETEKEMEREGILELLYETCANLLSSREFTETPSKKLHLRVVSAAESEKMGIIAVPGLGDFGRVGLLYWQATHQMASEKDLKLTLTTLKSRGFFDGQIQLHVQRFRTKIYVTAHLCIPKGGRKIPKKMASTLVQALAESVVNSASQRTKQTLARRSVSRSYKSASNLRAKERRHSRFEREKLTEEMSEDRRRKWQRQNPDAGRYKPSGHRLQSPNNC
jgi:hypothetical protein